MGFDRDITYFVESESDSKPDRTVLLALYPRLENDRLSWFDTVRDRSLRVDELEEEADSILVTSPKGTYRFSPLTVERYEEYVRSKVEGRPHFTSDEALQQFYRNLPA